MNRWFKLLICIVVCEVVGILGSIFTLPSIPTWYASLNKPFFNPPSWLFGPVWTTLYLFMGVSMYLVWKKGFKNKNARIALAVFLAQLGLNFLWSLIFFGLHLPALALVDIIFLWIFIALTTLKFSKISKPASYLLCPYLAWVTFASALNIAIVKLNP
jgi:tryptophan-rich sensory protein